VGQVDDVVDHLEERAEEERHPADGGKDGAVGPGNDRPALDRRRQVVAGLLAHDAQVGVDAELALATRVHVERLADVGVVERRGQKPHQAKARLSRQRGRPPFGQGRHRVDQ